MRVQLEKKKMVRVGVVLYKPSAADAIMATQKQVPAFKITPSTFMLSTLALVGFTLLTLASNFSPLPTWTVRTNPLPVQVNKQQRESRPPWDTQVSSAIKPNLENILCVFTGRWEYLRINFAYIYRSLRRNGGVLDRVYYYMMQYNEQTLSKLINLTETANKVLGERVFELRIRNQNENTATREGDAWSGFVYEIFDEIARHSERKYFKMDDDIVYIHPGAFRQLIEQQNSSECFIHFANIGGGNWRCSYIHQEMGIYDNKAINPEKMKFEFNRNGIPKCGWKSERCAVVALKAFFQHYRNNSLEKFLFDGRYLTPDRARFSINFFLLDFNLIATKAMIQSGPIVTSDERWLTQIYSRKVKNPNCIVGRAFVVHFSYYTTLKKLKKYDFLQQFEAIAYNLVERLPKELQPILAFNKTF